jgi:uncharacterized membrane protein (DUF4010 family)
MWIKQFLGSEGLLGLAAIVGVADIDPFILSIINTPAHIGNIVISAIIISMMSNTIVKGIYFGFLAKGPRKQVSLYFTLWVLVHVVLLFL